MDSTALIPELQRLPSSDSEPRTYREMIENLIRLGPVSEAMEISIATYIGIWSVFDHVNVDDQLQRAYEEQYPDLAEQHSLHDHFSEMMDRGPDSVEGFLNGIKGKLAEINTADYLEAMGFTDVQIAADPTQPVWDISAMSPDGEQLLFQVKTGGAEYAGEVMDRMLDNPGIQFAVSAEIFDVVSARAPELLEQVRDIGSDYNLVQGAEDGLSTLSGNLGIDVPDGLSDALPMAAAIMGGARLIYGAIQTERMFKDADRTTKNKIQVVQALTLMSRVGVSATMSSLGAAGGTAVGSAVPFFGNLIGGLVGGAAGAGMGMYLNRRLEPHILELGLNITGLDGDDLFYFKNKSRIDQRAWSFRENAVALGPASDS